MNGPLIKKIYVPKYMFVLSRIFSSSINLLASFTAMIFVMLAMRVELHYTVLLAPIPLLFIVFFSLGVGLILSAITVKFREYHAFVFSICYCFDVFDTGYLPYVDSSRMVEENCIIESTH